MARPFRIGLGGQRLFGAVVRPLQAFSRLEAASGLVLLLATTMAILWANLDETSYAFVFASAHSIRAGELLAHASVRSLVNDLLMTVFFFVVGMEIKRELVMGELDSFAKATLPAIAAVGGMIAPTAIFLALNRGRPGESGWGIPMATDIAFCVGILTLLGKHVPRGLVVFVTALAIFDDIGGILVIALFYGHALAASWLLLAAGIVALLAAMNRARVTSGLAYAVAGAGLWYALSYGGVHATIAGVIVGFAIPSRSRRPAPEVIRELSEHVRDFERRWEDEALDRAELVMIERKLRQLDPPLDRLVQRLHPLVAFGIMTLFALANAGIPLRHAGPSNVTSPVTLGVAAGLFLGKAIGIASFTLLAVKLKLSPMPAGASVPKLLGVSIIAGIGFTVALFIAGLAFDGEPALLAQAKLGVLMGSVIAGVTGAIVIRATGRHSSAAA